MHRISPSKVDLSVLKANYAFPLEDAPTAAPSPSITAELEPACRTLTPMELDSASDDGSETRQLLLFTMSDQSFIFHMTAQLNRTKHEGKPNAIESETKGLVEGDAAANVEDEEHDGIELESDDEDVLAALRLSVRRLALQV